MTNCIGCEAALTLTCTHQRGVLNSLIQHTGSVPVATADEHHHVDPLNQDPHWWHGAVVDTAMGFFGLTWVKSDDTDDLGANATAHDSASGNKLVPASVLGLPATPILHISHPQHYTLHYSFSVVHFLPLVIVVGLFFAFFRRTSPLQGRIRML